MTERRCRVRIPSRKLGVLQVQKRPSVIAKRLPEHLCVLCPGQVSGLAREPGTAQTCRGTVRYTRRLGEDIIALCLDNC